MSTEESVANLIREEDVIRYAQELVRIRCENPPSTQYEEMMDYLRGSFSALGLTVEIIGKPGFPNILGRLVGEKGSPTFIIDGHVDTVPAGDPTHWTVDPYGGEVKEGKIFGRGASDQRGGIAASIAAVKALVDSGEKLKGNLILLGHSDSETGGFRGIKWLVDNRPEKIKADWGLGTEPMGFVVYTVCRGTLWLEITTKGKTGHTGIFNDPLTQEKPVNAVARMVKILTGMQDVDSWMSFQPSSVREYGMYSSKPIVEVGGVIDLDGTGGKVNMIPAMCRAQVDIRTLPDQTDEKVVKELEALIARLKADDPEMDAAVKTIKFRPPWRISENNPFIGTVKTVASAVLGRECPVGGAMTIGEGAQALGKLMPITNFGPRCFRAHGIDEYVLIDDLVVCAKTYAVLYVTLLG